MPPAILYPIGIYPFDGMVFSADSGFFLGARKRVADASTHFD